MTASRPYPASDPVLLVVDDEPLIRDVLRDLFVGDGYVVHTAADVSEAEIILTREMIAVALVDLKLPDNDGIHVLDRIKQADPSVSVILMTGYPTLESVIMALQHGAFNYIVKPFRLHEIQKTVRQALVEFDKERRVETLKRRVHLLEELLQRHGIAVSDRSPDRPTPSVEPTAAGPVDGRHHAP